jgi:hypothetical protein
MSTKPIDSIGYCSLRLHREVGARHQELDDEPAVGTYIVNAILSGALSNGAKGSSQRRHGEAAMLANVRPAATANQLVSYIRGCRLYDNISYDHNQVVPEPHTASWHAVWAKSAYNDREEFSGTKLEVIDWARPRATRSSSGTSCSRACRGPDRCVLCVRILATKVSWLRGCWPGVRCVLADCSTWVGVRSHEVRFDLVLALWRVFEEAADVVGGRMVVAEGVVAARPVQQRVDICGVDC